MVDLYHDTAIDTRIGHIISLFQFPDQHSVHERPRGKHLAEPPLDVLHDVGLRPRLHISKERLRGIFIARDVLQEALIDAQCLRLKAPVLSIIGIGQSDQSVEQFWQAR